VQLTRSDRALHRHNFIINHCSQQRICLTYYYVDREVKKYTYASRYCCCLLLAGVLLISNLGGNYFRVGKSVTNPCWIPTKESKIVVNISLPSNLCSCIYVCMRVHHLYLNGATIWAQPRQQPRASPASSYLRKQVYRTHTGAVQLIPIFDIYHAQSSFAAVDGRCCGKCCICAPNVLLHSRLPHARLLRRQPRAPCDTKPDVYLSLHDN
jgi:hypothetical protein